METGLERWLKALGFEANPFAYREAGNDPYLNRYFVAPPYFDEILGNPELPQTAIVFAPRGGGKTALRVMVDYHCLEGLTKNRVLSALYTDFTRIVEAVGYDLTQITPRLHSYEILTHMVVALTEWLVNHLNALQRLNESQKVHLEWYLLYFGDYISPYQASILAREGMNFHLWRWEARKRIGFLRSDRELPSGINYALRGREFLPPAQLLDEFAGLIGLLGFDAIYVLVDRVDEFPLTAANPGAMIALLEPLVADLTLMNLTKVVFKFFLPARLEEAILAVPTIRPDRLIIRRVEWTDKALLQVIHRRLQAFSDYSCLDELCVPELRGRIEREIVALAKGSPRNLVRLGELLFSEQGRISATEAEQEWAISEEAWEAAKQRFLKEMEIKRAGQEEIKAIAQLIQAQEKDEEVFEMVRTQFPAPIAMVCRDFLIQPAPERRFRRMLDLFTVTMHFCLFLLIGSYVLQMNEDAKSPRPLRNLLGYPLERISLGQICQALSRLSGTLAALGGKSHFGRLFQRFYNRNSSRLERFIELRNRFAHGALENSEAYSQALTKHIDDLAQLFRELSFLGESWLVWVENLKYQEKKYIHRARLCIGDNPNFRWVEFAMHLPLECGHLWIVKDGGAVPMYPFVLLARCERCGQDEIFLYNRRSGENLEYLSYVSGHLLLTRQHRGKMVELLGL